MTDLEINLQKAGAYLARFKTDGVPNHIGGKSLPALDGETFETISPFDLKSIGKVAHGKAADVDRAAAAARSAFPAWAAMDGEMRKAPREQVWHDRRHSAIGNVWHLDSGLLGRPSCSPRASSSTPLGARLDISRI